MGTDNLFWKKKHALKRKRVGSRGLPKERFLILCEGEKTEPNYFDAFKVKSATVKVRGKGMNTDSLVEEAIVLKKQAKRDKNPYEQVWCVFDRDSFPPGNFNRALQIAKNNDIHAAYSNEAFELWYILHFDYIDSAISRADYQSCLTEKIGHEYKKNSVTMYEELLDKQPTAIHNAERLLSSYPYPNPAQDNPSTTVHELVQELNKYL